MSQTRTVVFVLARGPVEETANVSVTPAQQVCIATLIAGQIATERCAQIMVDVFETIWTCGLVLTRTHTGANVVHTTLIRPKRDCVWLNSVSMLSHPHRHIIMANSVSTTVHVTTKRFALTVAIVLRHFLSTVLVIL